MKPDIGIHQGIPADVYHQWDAASSHRLSLLSRSPAHLRHELDNPAEQTPAMAFGEAVHVACLEPVAYFKGYVVKPECDRRTKEGKATWEAFCAEANGRKIISRDEWDAINRIHSNVFMHPTAGRLLAEVAAEISAAWRDDETGQLCKLRADALSGDAVVDLKTTDDASRDGFERSILRYGYHRQAAMYLHGLAALGRPFDHFVFICVEKDPPHAVGVYRLDDEAIEAGWAECRELLATYAECERCGKWPAYAEQVQTISLPPWHFRRLRFGALSI